MTHEAQASKENGTSTPTWPATLCVVVVTLSSLVADPIAPSRTLRWYAVRGLVIALTVTLCLWYSAAPPRWQRALRARFGRLPSAFLAAVPLTGLVLASDVLIHHWLR